MADDLTRVSTALQGTCGRRVHEGPPARTWDFLPDKYATHLLTTHEDALQQGMAWHLAGWHQLPPAPRRVSACERHTPRSCPCSAVSWNSWPATCRADEPQQVFRIAP